MLKKIVVFMIALSCTLPLQAEVTFRNNSEFDLTICDDQKYLEDLDSGDEKEVSLNRIAHGFFMGIVPDLMANIPENFVHELVHDGDVFLVDITANEPPVWHLTLGKEGADGLHYFALYEGEEPNNDEEVDSSSPDY